MNTYIIGIQDKEIEAESEDEAISSAIEAIVNGDFKIIIFDKECAGCYNPEKNCFCEELGKSHELK